MRKESRLPSASISLAPRGAFSDEERKIVKVLKSRVQESQRRLLEVKETAAVAAADLQGLKYRKATTAENSWREERELEQLRGEQTHLLRRTESLKAKLIEAKEKLATHELERESTCRHPQDHLAKAADLGDVREKLTALARIKEELLKALAQAQGKRLQEPPRPAWSGSQDLRSSSPLGLSWSGNTSAASVVSQRVGPTLSASPRTFRTGSSRTGSRGPHRATAAAQARAAADKLEESTKEIEGQIRRENDRAAGFAQRLEILKARGKQLEATLERVREDGSRRQWRLREDLKVGAQQIRDLMNLASVPVAGAALMELQEQTLTGTQSTDLLQGPITPPTAEGTIADEGGRELPSDCQLLIDLGGDDESSPSTSLSELCRRITLPEQPTRSL